MDAPASLAADRSRESNFARMVIETIGSCLLVSKWRPLSRRFISAAKQSRSTASRMLSGRSRRALRTTPPPQVLYRGRDAFSRTATLTPAVARQRAADAPAGPLPTITTSGELLEGAWFTESFPDRKTT